MMRNKTTYRVIPGLLLVMAIALAALESRTADAEAMTQMIVGTPNPAAFALAGSPGTPASGAARLDAHRQFALGMIETGNNDNEIGGAGEVSRYQIMPSVWKHYSQSPHYQNPDISLAVAQQHWSRLYSSFKQQTRREPSDFDMYVLWNTGETYYSDRGFDRSRLSAIVRNRAQRFVNLVECRDF